VKTATIDDLVEDFEFLDTWEDRYRYIIELGDQLEDMPAELKTEANRVQGCVSNVWLVARLEPGTPPSLHFMADSDSDLTRGLIAILVMLFSGKTAPEILAMDIESVFDQLQFRRHLSPRRNNGFSNMVKRLRKLAEQAS